LNFQCLNEIHTLLSNPYGPVMVEMPASGSHNVKALASIICPVLSIQPQPVAKRRRTKGHLTKQSHGEKILTSTNQHQL